MGTAFSSWRWIFQGRDFWNQRHPKEFSLNSRNRTHLNKESSGTWNVTIIPSLPDMGNSLLLSSSGKRLSTFQHNLILLSSLLYHLSSSLEYVFWQLSNYNSPSKLNAVLTWVLLWWLMAGHMLWWKWLWKEKSRMGWGYYKSVYTSRTQHSHSRWDMFWQ